MTTTNMEVSITKEEREDLIENFIPFDHKYKFEKGCLDVELLELKYAYANLPEAIADLYLNHVLRDESDEETFKHTTTARAFIQGLYSCLGEALQEWVE